jgi:hypothetical protein
MTKKAQGQGGNAIVVGKDGVVDLQNDGDGIVRAGKGGTGGGGGDAIHVSPGVKITIRNSGVIAGGDAGNSEADK